MSTRIDFPTDPVQCQDTVRNLIQSAEQTRAPMEVEWYRNHHYLQGARDFRNTNFLTGSIDANYLTQDGFQQFRYEDVVSKFTSQIGRLLQMDLSPKVKRRTIGLEDRKHATLAQIALTAAFPPAFVRQLQYMAVVPFTKYGCVGLGVVVEDGEPTIDVVPPWELVPIPPRPLDGMEEMGIARIRWVPQEWVRQLPTLKNKRVNWDRMTTTEVPVGEVMHASTTKFATYGGSVAVDASTEAGDWTRANYGGKKANKDKRNVPLVPYVELWTWNTHQQFVSNYITMAGWELLTRQDVAEYGRDMPVPLCKAVDIPTGGFYGRGYLSTIIPMNTEVEYCLGRLFQNIQDTDVNGILTIPTTLGISPLVERGEDGLKRILYRPDYTLPDVKPDALRPVNAGLMPVKGIELGVTLATQIANQPTEMMRGSSPGRTDSASSLGLLWETANTPLAASALSLARAFSGVYAAALAILPTIWGRDREIEIAVLDDAMAGVVIDPSSGTLNLQSGTNALPKPSVVDIGVVSTMPRSEEREKAELIQAYTEGRIDLLDFIIIAYKQNLPMPLGHEIEIQNYRRAVQNNVVLWNDGLTPGNVTVQDYDDHEIHTRVLQAFIASPEFYAGGEAVRQSFTDLLEKHMQASATYLEQLPYQEDAALESQQAEEQQGVMNQPPQFTQ